jgi:hypothetical protein
MIHKLRSTMLPGARFGNDWRNRAGPPSEPQVRLTGVGRAGNDGDRLPAKGEYLITGQDGKHGDSGVVRLS